MGLARQFKPIMARRCTPKVVLSFVVPMVLIMPVGPMGLLYMRTALLLPTLIAIGTPLIGAITSMATGTDSVATGRSPAAVMSLWWYIKLQVMQSIPRRSHFGSVGHGLNPGPVERSHAEPR